MDSAAVPRNLFLKGVLRAQQRKLSPLPGGNLQHRVGAPAKCDSTGRNLPADGEDRAVLVEEEEVEREAHAEGVDAGAAGDQEARPGFIAVQISETEETGAKARRHSNLAANDRGDGKAAKTRRDGTTHACSSPAPADLSPKSPLSSRFVAHRTTKCELTHRDRADVGRRADRLDAVVRRLAAMPRLSPMSRAPSSSAGRMWQCGADHGSGAIRVDGGAAGPAGANALSGPATHRHGTTMIGMIQHLLSLGLRESMGFNCG
jgi:hypothetical protein